MNCNEILKPFTERPVMNVGGRFQAVNEEKINVLRRKDVNVYSVLRAVLSAHPELLNDAEKINEVKNAIIAEMNSEQENTKTK